jgi:hypothetical protein
VTARDAERFEAAGSRMILASEPVPDSLAWVFKLDERLAAAAGVLKERLALLVYVEDRGHQALTLSPRRAQWRFHVSAEGMGQRVLLGRDLLPGHGTPRSVFSAPLSAMPR